MNLKLFIKGLKNNIDIKVLFVSSANSQYGIVPFIKSQGESLKNEKIDVDYFSINGKGIKNYLTSIIALRKYIIKEKKYNIIHAHYGLSALVAFFGKKKEKLVVSFMGDDLVGSNDLNGNITTYSKIQVFINKIFGKYFFHYSIVKSKEMLNVLDLTNSDVIPNGVDFDRFYEINKDKARGFLKEKLYIKQLLFCSDPDRPEKNFKLANKAMSYLSDKNVELKYIHGIDQENLVNYYNSADCLLLTSFHEGSPNVVKEAMACNIPIVSTNVGDVKAVIGKTKGCFITTFDPEDVADKIEKALNFGKRTTGREDVKHLESSVVAKRIIDVYKNVIEK